MPFFAMTSFLNRPTVVWQVSEYTSPYLLFQEIVKMMEKKIVLEHELILTFTSETSFKDISLIRRISQIKKLLEEATV